MAGQCKGDDDHGGNDGGDDGGDDDRRCRRPTMNDEMGRAGRDAGRACGSCALASAAAAQRVKAPSGADRVCSRLLPALPERVDAVMSHPWHTRGPPPGPMTDATSCSTAGLTTHNLARERGRL